MTFLTNYKTSLKKKQNKNKLFQLTFQRQLEWGSILGSPFKCVKHARSSNYSIFFFNYSIISPAFFRSLFITSTKFMFSRCYINWTNAPGCGPFEHLHNYKQNKIKYFSNELIFLKKLFQHILASLFYKLVVAAPDPLTRPIRSAQSPNFVCKKLKTDIPFERQSK